MSYSTWTVKGYGICVDDINKHVTFEKLEKLCKLSENVYSDFQDDIIDYVESEFDMILEEEFYEERYAAAFKKASSDGNISNFLDEIEGEFSETGLPHYLRKIIMEVENIELGWAEDFECDNYLLMIPYYPWSNVSEKEKNMTENDAIKMFKKYINIFTDEEIFIGYRDVQNGG